MKRILILGTAAAVLGVAAPAAQASCGTACLRTKVNTLTREVNSLTTTVQGLTNTVNTMSGTVNSLGGTVNSLSGNVTAYHNAQVSDEATLTKLTSAFGCFGEYPVTDYGDPDGTFGYPDGTFGYLYFAGSGSPFDTTALDVTSSGDAVGAWTLFDQCNTAQTSALARPHLPRSGDGIAASFLLDPFAR